MNSSRSPDIELKPDESMDGFMEGRLKIIQSKQGYRFSIDAILLSEFASTRPGDKVIDLGTGCGIIPLVLLLTRPIDYAIGLEIQPNLASQAVRNARLNQVEHKMAVAFGDIRNAPLRPSCADLVTCNPPYRKKDSGRLNPDPEKAIARHEILASIDDILDVARKLLKPKGRLSIIYPAFRTADILAKLRPFELEAKRMRVVYPSPDSDAKLVLIEAALGGNPGLKILPPLFDQGNFSIEKRA